MPWRPNAQQPRIRTGARPWFNRTPAERRQWVVDKYSHLVSRLNRRRIEALANTYMRPGSPQDRELAGEALARIGLPLPDANGVVHVPETRINADALPEELRQFVGKDGTIV